MFNLILVHLIGLLSPGPDFFYVSRLAAQSSRKNALAGVFGISLGVFIWATAAILGLAILFTQFPMIQGIIVLFGGSYLAYLGYKMTRVKNNAVFNDTASRASISALTEMRKGLLVNLSNAKVVIYFSSVMSLLLVNINQTWQVALALTIILLETFLYFYVISLLFSRKIIKQFYANYSRYIDNFAGVVFLGFGGYLIYQGITQILI